MFHFYWPWFALLLPLPFFIRWLIPLSEPNQNHGVQFYFPAYHRLKHAFAVNSVLEKREDKVFLLFLYAVWFCLVLALMQPEKEDRWIEVKNTGYDLMLAVDISASMQALDFSTTSKTVSRLDVTKEVVGKFALGRHGDRLGLITFGEKAYLYVPLTLDTASLTQMLNHTVSGMAGNATAIGDAIALSVRTLRERPEGSRVLVLLTDGEDNASTIPPLEAAKLAKHYGIRIYTIGIGKNGSVPFQTNFGYRMANVSMDEGLLKEVAQMTGGQYFLATDQKALESIYEQINTLERTDSNQSVYFIREPFYYYPLIIAAGLLLFLILYKFLDRRMAGEF